MTGGMKRDRYGMACALVVVHNSARHKRALAIMGGGGIDETDDESSRILIEMSKTWRINDGTICCLDAASFNILTLLGHCEFL